MKTARERLTAAEAQLSAPQRDLRQRFPAFDRLLRPALATPADIAAALKPDEALLLALPREGKTGRDSAWVARRWATSQVPSIAAWLALRQLPPAATAREPLIAWADPAYARAPAATATTTASGSREGARQRRCRRCPRRAPKSHAASATPAPRQIRHEGVMRASRRRHRPATDPPDTRQTMLRGL